MGFHESQNAARLARMSTWLKAFADRFLGRALRPSFREAHEPLRRELERNACLTARALVAQWDARGTPPTRLRDAEFRVFSQFGEDGIIQYLIRRVPMADEAFIEFGVEDYTESNTRFLLVNNNWRGLIIDGDPQLASHLRRDPIYWRQELMAVSAFVTTENINGIFEAAGFRGDIGLLSVDVDGNDYWLWKAIAAVQPRIVVCEYNSLFGDRYSVSVPYRADFDKTRAHFSNLYFGASLPALCHLAEEKGYRFVGSNSQGHNAFFVRADVLGELPALSAQEGYVRSRFRSSVNECGELTFLTGDERIAPIAGLEVVDVRTGQLYRVGDLMR
jgi:hypothetical protein